MIELVLLLASCTKSQIGNQEPEHPTVAAEPNAERVDYGLYGPTLACSHIVDAVTDVEPGITWNGITIGSSTLSEVREQLLTEGTELAAEPGSLHIWHSIPSGSGPPWLSVEACFNEDKILIVMKIGEVYEFHIPPEEWITRYGSPDRVTWSDGYSTRTVIWADDGIMTFAHYTEETQIDPPSVSLSWDTWTVIMFPPIPALAFDTSWLTLALPQELLGSAGDYGPVPPPVEDPWGIQR